MSEILNEQLSALLDGELPPEETTLLLTRLRREPALAQRLARYRLGGEVLRGERVQPRADFALRISTVVAAEPPLAAPPAAGARWLRPLAGLAVAASVALVALLAVQRGPSASGPPEVAAAPVVTPAASAARAARAAPAYAEGSGEPESYVTPAARPRLGVIPEAALANYVVAHSQVSAPLAGRSVLIHLVADESRVGAPTP